MCAEFEVDWIDWFQFSVDEIKFESIFSMDRQTDEYFDIQYIFEFFCLKEYMRNNMESYNDFYEEINQRRNS